MKRLLAILALVLLAAGVLSSPLAAQGPQRVKKDRNVITQEEIRQSTATNVQDLVRSFRPHWLRIRGSSMRLTPASGTGTGGQPLNELTPQEIPVYVDGMKLGNQETLRTLLVSEVESLQFLDAGSATQRWGTGHTNGAIVVNRKTGAS